MKVQSYSEHPEMSAQLVADFVEKSIVKGTYEFICVNFANPDMVGHTGDRVAGEKLL